MPFQEKYIDGARDNLQIISRACCEPDKRCRALDMRNLINIRYAYILP
jgi:hypothetical protein